MDKPKNTPGITRRDFLKLGGAAAAGTVIAGSAEAGVNSKSTPTSRGPDYDKMVHSVCNYCGMGCGLEIYVKDGSIVHINGDPESPINNGSLCSKGSSTIQLINNDLRVKKPMKRSGNGNWQEISWNEAINLVADKLAETKAKYGAGALATYGTVSVSTEESYLFYKMARTLGMTNLESQGVICHGSALHGMKNTYGTGATSNQWTDVANTKCALIIGTNIVETHPIAFQHITKAVEENDAKIVVIDPRFTKTAAKADLHLQLRPGTDIAMINSIINYVIDTKAYDEKFLMEKTAASFIVDRENNAFVLETEKKQVEKKDADENPVLDEEGNPIMEEIEVPIKGAYRKADSLEGHPDTAFNILKETVAPYTFEEAERITWVPKDKIEEAAKTLVECSSGTNSKNNIKNCASVSTSTGMSQHTIGVQNIRSIGILQLLLGNMGYPGGGHLIANGHNVGAAWSGSSPGWFIGTLPVRGNDESWEKYFGLLGGAWTGEGEEPTAGEIVKDITKPVSDPVNGAWTKYDSCCSMKRGILAVLNYWCMREDQMPQGKGKSTVPMFRAMKNGEIKTYWAFGSNPAVAAPNLNDTKEGLKNLDVLIVSDLFESETAAAERKPDGITIFLPVCSFAEKFGSRYTPGRVVQWCDQAVDPMYNSKSDIEIVLRVAKKLSDKGVLNHDENIPGSAWDKAWARYGFNADSNPDEYTLTGSELNTAAEETYKEMDFCVRLFRGQYDWNSGEILAKRRDRDPGELGTTYPNWGWCWPMNKRMLYPDGAFMTPEKKGLIYAPSAPGGPMPVHQEPVETPMPEEKYKNKFSGEVTSGTKEQYPVVMTTHRVLEHFQAGQRSRNNPWLCELGQDACCSMSSTLAGKLGVNDGDNVKVTTARHKDGIILKARIDGRMDNWTGDKQVVSISWQWGDKGLSTGVSGNLLTIDATAPVGIPEYKVCLCNVEKA